MNRTPTLAECSHPISWVSVGISRNVRCGIPIRATHYYNIYNTSSQTVHNINVNRPQHHRNSSATHLFRDGYAFWKQKPPFCISKTILLHTKNPLFGVQKGGFCSVKKAGLHNKNEQPKKPLPVATMPNTHTPPHNNTTHSAHAYA